MSDCKAAIYSPANACGDKCKWPNACARGDITEQKPVEDVQEEQPKEPAKPKGRKKKSD